MSAVSIEIGEGDSQIVLDDNVSFNFDHDAEYKDSGELDKAEYVLELRGDVVAGTPGAVWDSIIELDDAVNSIGPKRVRILLDGEAKFDFEPVDCVNSPLIRKFKTEEDEGSGAGHWRWTMIIYVRKVGSQVEEGADQPQGLYEYQSSVSVTQVDEVVTEKKWMASAKAKDIGTAYAQVSTFGPTPKKGSGITREIRRDFEDKRVTAAWTWKRSRLFDIEEEITITGGGDVYVEDPVTGGADPNLHLAMRPAQHVLVRGVIYGPDANLQPPPAHFTETETLKRQRGEEQVSFAQIWDAENGIYARRFEERYIATGGVPGLPNHHGHDVIKKISQPEDGAL
jgi:hypothetical protein